MRNIIFLLLPGSMTNLLGLARNLNPGEVALTVNLVRSAVEVLFNVKTILADCLLEMVKFSGLTLSTTRLNDDKRSGSGVTGSGDSVSGSDVSSGSKVSGSVASGVEVTG